MSRTIATTGLGTLVYGAMRHQHEPAPIQMQPLVLTGQNFGRPLIVRAKRQAHAFVVATGIITKPG